MGGMPMISNMNDNENLIYIELIRRGYEVYVGQYNDIEIDFIAIKPNEKTYFQITRSIIDEKVEELEKKSLLAINDNYKKNNINYG